MKTRPILMSAPMVRALLAGTKTQTRRVCKVRDIRDESLRPGAFHGGQRKSGYWAFRPWNAFSLLQGNGDPLPDYALPCPYGVPGDRLYVREVYYQLGHWEPVAGQVTRKGNRQKWRFVVDSDEIRFESPPEFRKGRHSKDPGASVWHKRLARFMPRWASRLTLEVTAVRVERVQDISEEDARAEGVSPSPFCKSGRAPGLEHVDAFEELWQIINNRPGVRWDDNPWVWVVSFKVVT